MRAALLPLLVVPLTALAAGPAPPPAKGAGPAAPPPSVSVLDDGTALVFAKRPGAPDAALRIVVEAGPEHEPPGKAGLASLVAALALEGTYDLDGGALRARVDEAGGRLASSLELDVAVFSLDGPREGFLPLVEAVAPVLTNPALPFADLDRVKARLALAGPASGVRDVERLALMRLFPSGGPLTPAAAEKERAALTLSDALLFLEERYGAARTTLIVVGDLDEAEVKAALLRSLRWPPERRRPVEPFDGIVQVPAEGAAPAPSSWHALAWPAGGRERAAHDGAPASVAACRAAAALLELRARREVLVRRGLAADVRAACRIEAGRRALVLLASSKHQGSTELPEALRQAADDAAKVPPSAKEKAAIEGRARAATEAAKGRPSTYADLLVDAARARGPSLAADVEQAVGKAACDPKAVAALLRASVARDAELSLQLSPPRSAP